MNKTFNQLLTVIGFIVLVAGIAYAVIYASSNNGVQEKFNWACEEGCHNMYIQASQEMGDDKVRSLYDDCRRTCQAKYLPRSNAGVND